MKIDFVSDVVCPWCAIGLHALEAALVRLGEEVSAEIHFQPFELNPDLPPEGENLAEHIKQKFGSTAEHFARMREAIRARGEAVGFDFRFDDDSRIYNTFDAHRLLHWAELEGCQAALKHALFKAQFSDGQDLASRDVLSRLAGAAGLDRAQARGILVSNAYAEEVRQRERFYLDRGIDAVPAVIINDRHLIRGGQPVAVFEQMLRQLAAPTATDKAI